MNNQSTNTIKKFDKEYNTQWAKEMIYLRDVKGIDYAFVKETNGIVTYKYTKNSKLFKALTEFYLEIE